MKDVRRSKRTRGLLRSLGVGELVGRWRSWKEFAVWLLSGRAVPSPPRFKHLLVKRIGRYYRLGIMVETGTYLGDTVAACQKTFSRLVSIELSPELARAARERFRGLSHVEILEGDSGEILPTFLKTLSEPALFWLDGHYSGGITAMGSDDTPVWRELEAVLGRNIARDVILVDDARLFDGRGTYPSLDEVRELVRRKRPGAIVVVEHDVIRVLPPGG